MDGAHETTVPVRYRDLDPQGHVNNAVFATYVEEGRVDFLRAVLDVPRTDPPVVVASLSFDFERRVTLDDRQVVVTTRVPALGRTSVTTAHEVRVGENVAASAEAILVHVTDGEPTPLPASWRTALQ